MQRLVHLAHVAGSQTRGHRLNTLALDRQHEALGVVFDGNNAIGMPGGLGQTVQIGLQTLRLAGEIRLVAAHRPQRTASQSPAPEQSKQTYLVYNTVVLGSSHSMRRRYASSVSCHRPARWDRQVPRVPLLDLDLPHRGG